MSLTADFERRRSDHNAFRRLKTYLEPGTILQLSATTAFPVKWAIVTIPVVRSVHTIVTLENMHSGFLFPQRLPDLRKMLNAGELHIVGHRGH